jgi:hypothetical protein
MKISNITIIILSILFFNACSQVRESAGVTRKSMDEFQVVENPPLVIPPDFNLLPPDQLSERNINNIENDLAQEILFGLDNKINNNTQKLSIIDNILSNANALDLSPSLREDFDQEFSQELKTDSIFRIKWENEVEVLDALKESERIRNSKFKDEPISVGETPTKTETIKIRKKKRFIFF